MSLGVGGWMGRGGAADSEEERKGKVLGEKLKRKADKERDIAVWLCGATSLCVLQGITDGPQN